MEKLMEQLSRGPKPPPQPVCNNNCGQVFVARPNGFVEVTCPCGYGYYDGQRQEFIPGSLVRAGKRPTREDYVAHVRQCSRQMEGSPIVSTVFHGAHKGETPVAPQSGARYTNQPERHATPTPSDGAPTEKSRDRSDRVNQDELAEEKTVSNTSTRAGQSIFIPRANIEEDALIYYLRLLGCDDVELEEHNKNQKAGWLMKGFDLKLEPLEWKDLLSGVIQDSQLWLNESRRSDIPYENSRAAAKRKRDGPIKLQLKRKTSSSINAKRPNRTPTQSLDNIPRVQHDTTEYGTEAAKSQRSTSAHHDPLVDPASRHNERKGSSEYQSAPSQDSRSRHTKGPSLDSGIGGSPKDLKSNPRRMSSEDNEESSESD